MKIKKEVISTNDIALCLLLVAATNFANKYFYIVFIAFAVYLFFVQRVYFNLETICLFILSLSTVFFAPWTRDTVLTMIKPFVYPMCYMMGMGMFAQRCGTADIAAKEKYTGRVFIAIASGNFIHYLLNWVTNIDADKRNTVDFWTHEVLASTNQAVMGIIALGVAIAVIFGKTGATKKVIALVIIALIMTYNLILAGRTLIALLLIGIAIASIFRLLAVKENRLKFLLILLCVILTITLCWKMDLFGIKSGIEQSLLYDRFTGEYSLEVTEDGRMENKLQYLKMIWQYPLGGANVRKQVGHAHDIFLDTFDESGVFAFLAIVLYLIMAITRLIRGLKSKCISYNMKQLLLCVYSVTFIMFCLEPILVNASWFFAGFCTMDGCASALINGNKGETTCPIRSDA